MRRRAGLGGNMRSVVGFLSQRGLQGDPLLTQDFQRRRLRGCRNLYKKDLLGHFGCVNAIEFSNNGGQWLVSGGDDRRVLLWHMERAITSRVMPIQLKGEHHSNIFCLAFNSGNTRVFSGGNDEQVLLHDVESGETLDVFAHEDAVYGLSVSPVNDNVFASSSDDGRVLIWDIRESSNGDPFCLANYPSAFHSVMFNPVEPRLLATANSKEGVGLWDIRKPQSSLLRYGGNLSLQSAMSVRFNSNGTQLLALRRRLPPVLYDIHSRLPVFQFDNQGYFNSCTMKSCCFAGDRDQYILSGSDDFHLYMWRIPPDPEAGGIGRVVNGAFMVLKGHRSIVNQVRFNPHTYMICSSGVEKIIKIWSPYRQPGCTGDLDGKIEDDSRCLYTHEEYISLVLNSGSGLSHDYANQSVQEDPRMMAFFDSLVRREIEGWSSDSDSDLSESTILQLHAGVSERSGYSESESSTSVRHSPPHMAEESDEAAYNLGTLRSTESPPAREDVATRRQRLSALRRYQDKRLLALSNESDSDENTCETELDADLFPRPRSPSPEENDSSSSSSSSSSSEDDEELNKRRSSTRQRNAMRHRSKLQKEERTSANPENTSTYIGEDIYDYPQIKVDDLSPSPTSSPERSAPSTEVPKEKVSPCSESESVDRKIYRAFRWLHYSYMSYTASKDGESSRVGEIEGRPGTSRKIQGGQDSSIESCKKETFKEHSSGEYSRNGPEHECDDQQQLGDQESLSHDTGGNGSMDYSFESKKLNGKTIGQESCTEEPCSQGAGFVEHKNSQNCQPPSSPKLLAVSKDSFSNAANCSGPGSCSRNLIDESEERNTDNPCANHNNGHLHPRSSYLNNGQSLGEEEAVSQGRQLHINVENGSHVQTCTSLHKEFCLSAADSTSHSVSMKEEVAELHPADNDGLQIHGRQKRHRAEFEDTDSENSSSEKKLKT
ncbi:DDB1- and CUL4-associated factor 5 [Heteronotia binoei]|uniref:DDB1- and CUL4-associated factor 5 n=1 Tax=Heteronotia binoei TaxID=13085 RepID=UPI0029307A8F|nr:DDB1- and CUL4-associated factor 5 [Heteronotia binoei]